MHSDLYDLKPADEYPLGISPSIQREMYARLDALTLPPRHDPAVFDAEVGVTTSQGVW